MLLPSQTHLEQFQKGSDQARPDWQAAHWPDCLEEEYNPEREEGGRNIKDKHWKKTFCKADMGKNSSYKTPIEPSHWVGLDMDLLCMLDTEH